VENTGHETISPGERNPNETVQGFDHVAITICEEAAMISGTSLNDGPDLSEAISQLRNVLALPTGLTTDHLIRLQNAIEVAERAVRAERWAREGYEFLGE
jgi:hypothetical protein